MKATNSLGPGLVIGIPTLGRPIPLDWAMAFKGLNPPINFNVNMSIVRGQQVADARNAIAEASIRVGAKYLFFLGDDVVVPPHTLKQLIFRMENAPDCHVVGGVYCCKCDPAAPLVFMNDGIGSYWDWKLGEFFQCTGLGMDCTLIRTSIFEKLSKPWFKTVDTDKYLDGINSAEQWTEDLYFFKKLYEEQGIRPYCDASVICDHWDIWNNRKYTLPNNSLPMRQKVVKTDKKCLILGPPIELNDPSYDITRCSSNGDLDADYRVSYDNLPFEENEFDWVIVTEHQTLARPHEEWLRVCKGKISVNYDEIINRELVAKLCNGSVDGTFVEVMKETKNGNVQSIISGK